MDRFQGVLASIKTWQTQIQQCNDKNSQLKDEMDLLKHKMQVLSRHSSVTGSSISSLGYPGKDSRHSDGSDMSYPYRDSSSNQSSDRSSDLGLGPSVAFQTTLDGASNPSSMDTDTLLFESSKLTIDMDEDDEDSPSDADTNAIVEEYRKQLAAAASEDEDDTQADDFEADGNDSDDSDNTAVLIESLQESMNETLLAIHISSSEDEDVDIDGLELGASTSPRDQAWKNTSRSADFDDSGLVSARIAEMETGDEEDNESEEVVYVVQRQEESEDSEQTTQENEEEDTDTDYSELIGESEDTPMFTSTFFLQFGKVTRLAYLVLFLKVSRSSISIFDLVSLFFFAWFVITCAWL